MVKEVTTNLNVEIKKLQAKLDQSEKAYKDLQTQVAKTQNQQKKLVDSASKGFNNLKNIAGQLGITLGAAFAISKISSFISESQRLFDIQAKQEAKLLKALKGREDSQQRLIKQAQDLQKLTLFGDELTIQAQALLASLGLTESQITKLIPLIQDMSIAMGIDFLSATSLVGKSVATTTDALARYFDTGLKGVSEQSERAIVLTETLTRQFQGQAEVAAGVGTGSLTQMQNQLDDISEELGAKTIPATILYKKELLSLATNVAEIVDSDNVFKGYLKALDQTSKLITFALAPGLRKIIENLGDQSDETENLNGHLTKLLDLYREAAEVTEKTNEETETQIRNYAFLTKQITDLQDELKSETATREENLKVSEKIKELTKERNDLLGIEKKETDDLNKETKSLTDQREELIQSYITGTDVTWDQILAINEQVKAEQDLKDEITDVIDLLDQINNLKKEGISDDETNIDNMDIVSKMWERAGGDLLPQLATGIETTTDKTKEAIEAQKARAEADVEAAEQAVNAERIKQQAVIATSQIISSLIQRQSNLIRQQTNEEIRAAQQAADFKIKLAGTNADQINKINQELDDEIEKLQREAAERQKRLAILEATVDFAVGIVKIWSQSGIAVPVAIAISALLTAVYAAQLALITSQSFAKGTISSDEGWAEVGERGREIVWMPQNSKVFNNQAVNRYDEAIEAMNKGTFDDMYFNKKELVKAARKYEQSKENGLAQNIANSMLMQLEMKGLHAELFHLNRKNADIKYILKKTYEEVTGKKLPTGY